MDCAGGYLDAGDVDGNEAMIEDAIGNTLRLVYDNDTKSVYVKE